MARTHQWNIYKDDTSICSRIDGVIQSLEANLSSLKESKNPITYYFNNKARKRVQSFIKDLKILKREQKYIVNMSAYIANCSKGYFNIETQNLNVFLDLIEKEFQ